MRYNFTDQSENSMQLQPNERIPQELDTYRLPMRNLQRMVENNWLHHVTHREIGTPKEGLYIYTERSQNIYENAHPGADFYNNKIGVREHSRDFIAAGVIYKSDPHFDAAKQIVKPFEKSIERNEHRLSAKNHEKDSFGLG